MSAINSVIREMDDLIGRVEHEIEKLDRGLDALREVRATLAAPQNGGGGNPVAPRPSTQRSQVLELLQRSNGRGVTLDRVAKEINRSRDHAGVVLAQLREAGYPVQRVGPARWEYAVN